FESTDFSRARPYNPGHKPYDYILSARDEGASLIQSFYESMERKGGHLHNIIADVCAFANTNGGTIYVGISEDRRRNPRGVHAVNDAIQVLSNEISRNIIPSLDVEIDSQETGGKSIMRILVPYGEDRPYAIHNSQIYVRDEAETTLAVRDEIVNLVKQGQIFSRTQSKRTAEAEAPVIPPKIKTQTVAAITKEPDNDEQTAGTRRLDDDSPRAGVEIVAVEKRRDTRYFTMHDLRNGNIVTNVTKSSARKLWDYAIKEYERNPVTADKVQWQGEVGLWKKYEKFGVTRYDLAQRNGRRLRIFYGVTENGMQGKWAAFLDPDEE
ncbi:MAG: helix-turn-helix domain-containing protein, partial [Aggregatilineales bacterium]